MKIYIIGNPLVKRDSLPYALRAYLQKAFPGISLEEADPNENFIPEKGSVILDTVMGLHSVHQFEDIDSFIVTKSVSPHDYDLSFHLQLLKKLHKISNVTIIGLPQNAAVDDVKKDVCLAIEEIIKRQ